MTRPIRLATFAVPLSGNKGSASMFLGLRDAFTAAGVAAHFAVFSYYPKRDARIAAQMDNVSVHAGHPKHIVVLLAMIVLRAVLPFLVPARYKRDIDALRESDGVLLVGGTTFADSMLYKVPWNLLAALPGYWLRRRTMFLSQTVGPIGNPLNRAAARWTLRRAVTVQGRGRHSERWVRDLGIPATYQPDLSFTMSVPEFDEAADADPAIDAFRSAIHAGGRPAIGVAPNSIVYSKARSVGGDYVQFMAGVVQTIHEQGYLPVLIPHSYREDVSRIHNNDRSLCIAIRERLPAGVDCHYVDADLSSGQLRAMIGRLHLLVASRFHSMISALSMGVPPLTYGWGHHKYIEVLEEFDVAELYASYDELDIGTFAEKLAEMSGRREELSGRIRAAYVNIRQQSEHIPAEIASALSTSARKEEDPIG